MNSFEKQRGDLDRIPQIVEGKQIALRRTAWESIARLPITRW